MGSREDLSELSEIELKNRLRAVRRDLFFLSGEYSLARRVPKPHQLKLLRKTIARLLTEQRARFLRGGDRHVG
ncbi:50S ribosomal protein L29 [Candidatus Similichlamydia laticola]|uniref:Large ribosomal subunit protein uL29 n=1 Tax=Candidatus Similichlamydia laticola TaxID=2170265 RepID=A0A369KK62_9BACT|nr:hypothetical protein HAT2_00509 [Candidatus Similichlamydia laticola]